MRHPSALPASIIVVGLSVTPCVAAPRLDGTALYATTTHGCQAVDLRSWRHPTLKLLKERDVPVLKVELCNGKKYPIFTVSFKYDPRGQTDDYFHRLYAEMVSTNGSWPFSFVDAADGVIIDVVPKGKDDIKIEYEDYEPAAPAK